MPDSTVRIQEAPAGADTKLVDNQELQNDNGDTVQRQKIAIGQKTGTWSYFAGVAGTVNVVGRVLQITAVALGGAGSVEINGGDAIPLPYNAADKASTEITIVPEGNLVDPEVVFTNTDSYFIEVVT